MSLGKYPWHQLSQYGEFADVQFGPKGKLFCSRMNLAGEAVVTVSRDFDIGFLSIPLPAGRADQLQIGPAGRFVVARDERTKDVYLLDVEVGMVHSMVGSTPPTAVLFAEPGFISMTNEHARHWNEPPAPARGGPEKSRMIAAYRTDSRGWFLLGTEGGFWRSVPGGSVELDVGLRRPDSTWQEYNRRLVDVSRDGSLLALARADGLSIVDDEGQRNIDVEGGVPAVAIAPNGRELAYWGLGSVFVVELGDDGSISSPRSVCSDCPIAVRRGFGWFEGRPWAVAEKGCSIYLMDMGQGVEIIDSPLELCSGVDVAHGVAAWRGRNADDERPKLVARRLDSGREFETVARPGEEFGLYVAVADAERVLFSVGPRVLLWEFEDTDERFDRDLVTREVLRTRDEITSIQRQADDSLTVMDGLHRVWEVPLQTDEERIAQLDSAVEVMDVEHP
jgi:hypothetical protein